jgi:hypothetical protein
MNRRVLVSIANLLAIVVAFVILIDYPQYSDYAFYFLILWMGVAFVLLFAFRPPLPSGATNLPSDPSPFPSTSSSSGAPLPSGSDPSPSVGFCIYCATALPPGTRSCPACGHALPGW